MATLEDKKEALDSTLSYVFDHMKKVRGYRQDISRDCLNFVSYVGAGEVFLLTLLVTAKWIYLSNNNPNSKMNEAINDVSRWAFNHDIVTNVQSTSDCWNRINNLWIKLSENKKDIFKT